MYCTELRKIILPDTVLGCKDCTLCETRRNVVLARGLYNYKFFIVGESPGEQEDYESTPFIGDSGVMLEKVFTTVLGISTNDCYVTNMVKCRPPGNKLNNKDWIRQCYKYLFKEIETLKPKIIFTLGNEVTHLLLNTKEGISQLNGNIYESSLPYPENFFTTKHSEKKYTTYKYVIIPLYHPSALIRNNTLESGSKKDQIARKLYEIKKLIFDHNEIE